MSKDTSQTSLILDVLKSNKHWMDMRTLFRSDHSFLFLAIIGNTIDDMTFPIAHILTNALSDRGQFTDQLRSRIVPNSETIYESRVHDQ